MGIRVTGIKEAKERTRQLQEQAYKSLLTALDNAGQRAVEAARASKTYQDRTGNLSASIGYGVYSDGNVVSTGGFLGGEGEAQGRAYLEQIQAQYAHHKFALIVVAGMEYAAIVERRGHVVLDGAKLRSDSIIREELSKIRL